MIVLSFCYRMYWCSFLKKKQLCLFSFFFFLTKHPTKILSKKALQQAQRIQQTKCNGVLLAIHNLGKLCSLRLLSKWCQHRYYSNQDCKVSGSNRTLVTSSELGEDALQCLHLLVGIQASNKMYGQTLKP